MSKEEFLRLAEENRINFTDFVVRGNVFRCNKNHEIEQIQAEVDIMRKDGTILTQKVPAGYCSDCNCYFILENDYRRLKSTGVLLCQQMTYEVYQKNGESIMNGLSLKPESLLHQCGYNVSSTESLSTAQRHAILRRVVDNGLYSISGICSHLDWLIDRNSRVVTKDMSLAIQKWKEDRDYIAAYQTQSQRIVGVQSIQKTKYVKK